MVSEEYFHTIFWVTFDIEMVYNSLSLKDHNQSCKFILDDIKKKNSQKMALSICGSWESIDHATCMENDLWSFI